MAIDVRSDTATFDPGPPTLLFPTRTKWIEIQATARTYAAAPDGQRFLVANAMEEAQSAPITVVLTLDGGTKKVMACPCCGSERRF